MPVAAGLAFSRKLKGLTNIGVVFIGDGTLGEGVVYETLNIVSKWNIPLLIVCENNFYAQSTKIEHTLAGSILARAEAFGIKTFQSTTEHVDDLFNESGNSIKYVRETGKPAFHLVKTYRLNAHSKGDDDRDDEEISIYKSKDPINVFAATHSKVYDELLSEVNDSINSIVETIETIDNSDISHYLDRKIEEKISHQWTEIISGQERIVSIINGFFKEEMKRNKKVLFIGEDVLSPYGGAFKIAKDLSQIFPGQVVSTPISEAAIVGVSNGLALGGFKPFVEIMFGDFVTLAFDQIVNHASKFYHMYNKQVSCPVVIRTPMGGGRGYGPTHSQSLDKFLLGIDNIKTVALNTLIDPRIVFESVSREIHPVIIIENKLDYGRTIAKKKLRNFSFLRSGSDYPLAKISPEHTEPAFTLVTYGGSVSIVLEALENLFYEHELLGEVIVLTQIHPIADADYDVIYKSCMASGNLFVIEEGSSFAGFGGEVIANVSENVEQKIIVSRLASAAVPIPSSSSLEKTVLVNSNMIVDSVKKKFVNA
jgi:2-oxoisovalerate dehydrogenase E1 component